MPDLALARRSLFVFGEVVGCPLRDFQVDGLALRKRISVVVAPRQSGKSRSLALLATHRVFNTPGLQVLVISAGEEAAKRLLGEIRAVTTGSDLLRGSVVDERAAFIELSNGSRIRSVPASERQIRGWTIDLLLIDEAALVSDDLILGAAMPTTAARPDARIVLASSATAASGAFYDLAQAGLRGDEHVETVQWALTDCPWISAGVIEAARATMTPARFAAEYEGVFASGADALFPRALLERASADYVVPGLDGLGTFAGLGGIDWGATTDRTTLVSIARLAQPAGAFVIGCAHAWPSGEALDGPGGIIGQIATETTARFDQLTVELNGLGYPLAQALRRRLETDAPHRATAFHEVYTSQDSKATTYSALRVMMEQGRLILPSTGAPELLRELLLLRVELSQSGGQRIEAGIGHDDLADGLYLAAAPYREHERWHSRLDDATKGTPLIEVTDPGPNFVETGSGLWLPRVPELVTFGGERYGPASSVISPLEPGGRLRSVAPKSAPPISTAAWKRGEETRAAAQAAERSRHERRTSALERMSGKSILDMVRRGAPRRRSGS